MEKLKKLQKESGKTIEQISSEIDIPIATLNRYLANVTEPTLSKLIKLSKYFNVSIDYLVGNDIRGLTVYSEEQNQAINMLVQLNELNLGRASSYIAGLLVGQN